MSHAIETKSLSYTPGRGFKLSDLSITVPWGSVYGFLGPNGSGKTTTIKLLLGLLRGSSGAISVLGHAIPTASAAALARVGYVPEAPHLYASLRVAQAIDYHAGFYADWDHVLADDLRERFTLRAEQRLGSLSKGELRKLMMLLAIAQRPRLLMLDEPTDGLDPVVRRDILDALLSSVRGGDTTVFLSSHLVHELEMICDWIAVMDKGNLITELPMTTFRNEIKVLHLSLGVDAAAAQDTPFTILRTSAGSEGSEHWVVRGWRPEMAAYFDRGGTTLHNIADVDLENGFVELLRSFRHHDA